MKETEATDEGDYECEGFWVHNAAVNQRNNCDSGILHWQSTTYALYQYDQAQLASVMETLPILWVLWQLSSSFISDLIVSGPRPGKEALGTAAAHTSVVPPPSQINKEGVRIETQSVYSQGAIERVAHKITDRSHRFVVVSACRAF